MNLLRLYPTATIWYHNHGHELHSATNINTVLKQVFPQVIEAKTAYLYRYFLPTLAQTEQGVTITSHVLELEKRMGKGVGL